jgi:YHS domain-containing protein
LSIDARRFHQPTASFNIGEETTMTRAYLVSALAGAALLGFSTGAIAAVAGEFGNYCAMGLTKGEKKLTDCSISSKIDGKTYCFGNNTAKEAFVKDPAANVTKAQETFSAPAQ